MWGLGFGGLDYQLALSQLQQSAALQYASNLQLTPQTASQQPLLQQQQQQLPPVQLNQQQLAGAKAADPQQTAAQSQAQGLQALLQMQLQLQAASSLQPALVGQAPQPQELALPPSQQSSVDSKDKYAVGRKAGIMDKVKSSFGFIKQDSGEDDIFVMPLQCAAFGNNFPPMGARVFYDLGVSSRTGKPIAENVRPGSSGIMHSIKGSFGFIKQDSGEDDIFVMPLQCPAFGSNLPPIGARVTYEVGVSSRTGKPIAEDVQPEERATGLAGQLALQNFTGFEATGQLALPNAVTAVPGVGQLALQNAAPAIPQMPSLAVASQSDGQNAANSTSEESAASDDKTPSSGPRIDWDQLDAYAPDTAQPTKRRKVED